MVEPAIAIRRLTNVTPDDVAALADVLIDCVAGGASVGFLDPLDADRARTYWRDVAGAVARGERALLVAEDSDGIVGTVQLVPAVMENQPHRADLSKMLVHRRARRRGVGRALMDAAEAVARDWGRTLLVLDTVPGTDAERLYVALGWQRVGVIPGYALWPNGQRCDTTVYYLELAG